jgi:cell filamentation protein
VTFDVFGDFETKGYLRNSEGLKDVDEVKRLEHRVFLKNLGRAVEHLKHVEQLGYQDVLDTHKILFQDVYPWAGQDRQTTAPDLAIGKGERNDLFAHPRFTQDAVHYALRLGQNRAYMAEHCGEVMGYLAHAHPFLEGNGRTLMVVLNELAHRAGISIDWSRTDKDAYLQALTRELERPGAGELDGYLRPFIGPAVSHESSSALLAELRGLAPEVPDGDLTVDDD